MLSRSSMLTTLPIASLVVLILTGCPKVNINTTPFSQFAESAQELRKGADAALTINDEENKKRFIEQTAEASLTEGGAEAITNLMISTDPTDPFSWKMEVTPFYMKSQKFRSGVFTLNTAIVKYADLLKELSSPDLLSTERFDNLTRDLNANLGSASKSLGFDNSGEGLAIFSVAATEMLRAYLDSQRKVSLLNALKENRKNIQEVSRKMQYAVRLAASNLNQNYSNEGWKLIDRLSARGTRNLKLNTELVNRLVELNQLYINRLAVLHTLYESYGTLPGANNDMINILENSNFEASAIKEIFENGKHLKDLHDELVKSGKSNIDIVKGDK